jgi:hypothetical protein
LNPAALGEVDAKDRTRQSGGAAIGHAAVIASAMCAAARSAHIDPELSTIARHRRAAELSAKAVLPWVSTMETAQAAYTKEMEKLREKVAGPAGDGFSEIQVAEARSKLSGMQPQQRFAAIKKASTRARTCSLR